MGGCSTKSHPLGRHGVSSGPMVSSDDPVPAPSERLPEGFCELEAADYVASEYARYPMFDRVFLFLLGVGHAAGDYLAHRTFAPFRVLLGVWMIFMALRLPHFLHRGVGKLPPGERRTTYVITPAAMIVRTESGSMQHLGWGSVEHLITDDGLALVEVTSGKLYPLPRRAWPGPPSEMARIRAYVVSASKAAAVPKIGRFVMIMIVVAAISLALEFVH